MPNFWEQRRTDMGLSQRGMATRLGVSNQAVSDWEAGRTVPTPTIEELAAAYDCDESEIEVAIIASRRSAEALRKARTETAAAAKE